MGLLIKSRKYSNRFRPELVDFLLGNTGDWQKLNLTCEFAVIKEFTSASPLILDNGNFLISDGGYWSDFGFVDGNTLTLEYDYTNYDSSGAVTGSGTTQVAAVISLISGDTAILNNPVTNNYTNMFPYQSGTRRYFNVKVYADKKPEGLTVNYNHLRNSDADATLLTSIIDGSITRADGIGLNTLVGWQQMTFNGSQSGMSINSIKWQYIGVTSGYKYIYELEIEYMISSFYELLSNFENNVIPSYLFDAESLTDNFKIIASPQLNNPNTKIENNLIDTKKLGSVGWFGENFNGKENNFTIESLIYEDVLTGDLVSKLSYSDEVKVTAAISGIANLSPTSKVSIGFIWVPEDESFYKNKTTPYHKNLLVNTAGDFSGGVFSPTGIADPTVYAGFSNDSSIHMDVRQVNLTEMGGYLIYEAIWSPSTGFKNFINSLDDSEKSYLLWISVADETLSTTQSDRVNEILDFNELEKHIPEVGVWDGLSIKYFEHNNDGSADEYCNLNMIIEDDILVKVEYPIDILEAIPNNLEYAIEIENIITGETITLENYNISLIGYPTLAQVPQVSFEESRNFHYVDGNNKNWVKIDVVAGSPNYVGYYGLKIRWEDWIQKQGIPNDFYNALLDNDGFSNNWINYLQHSDWKVVFAVYLEVNDDELGNVRYRTPRDLVFKGYEENDIIEELDWKFIVDSTNDVLQSDVDSETGKPLGIILDNENVRIEVVFTRNTGTWGAASDVYGLIAIETFRGTGSPEYRQLSSIVGSEVDNPLRPIVAGQKLKVELISPTKIKLSCLVDPALLQGVEKYKLSARINCDSN